MSLSQTDAAKDIFRQKDQLHGVVVAAVAAVVFVTVVVVVVVVGGGWLVVGGRWSVVGGRWRGGGGLVGDGGGWWAVGGGCGVVAVAVRRKTGGWLDLIKETPGAPPPPSRSSTQLATKTPFPVRKIVRARRFVSSSILEACDRRGWHGSRRR